MSTLLNWYPGDAIVELFAVIVASVTIVTLIGLVASLFLKRHAALRHCVLTSSLVWAMLCPVLAAIFFVADARWPISLRWRGRPASAAAGDELVPVFAADLPASDLSAVQSGEEFAPDAIATPSAIVAGEWNREATERTSRRWIQPQAIASAMLLVWTAGSLFLLGRLMRSFLSLRRLCRSFRPSVDDSLGDLMKNVQQQLAIPTPPRIVESHAIQVPAAMGLIRPVVVLPSGMLSALTDDMLHDVLIHEAAHILRRDHLVILMQEFAKILFWPIPSIHLLNRGIAAAREEICDNYVLDHRNVASYGETLWKIGSITRNARTLAMSAGILHWRGRLEQRVFGLLDPRRNRRVATCRVTSCVVFSLFALILPFCSTTFSPAQVAAGQNAAESASVDRYGDALPTGATARLGTLRFRHTGIITGLAFSHDGKKLVGLAQNDEPVHNQAICIWDSSTGQRLRTIDTDHSPRALAVLEQGSLIASLGFYFIEE